MLYNKLKFSIVTVVLNDLDNLKQTYNSIIEQDYPNHEYIIVDGDSNDGTKEFISESKGITHWLSEPDKGIYDAMNKGSRLATGDYVQFLNAGDRLLHPKVLTLVNNSLIKNDTDILVGDGIVCSEEKGFTQHVHYQNQIFDKLYFLKYFINHQSIFAKRELVINDKKFRTDLRIRSDYDWTIKRIIEDKCTVSYKSIGVIIYKYGGYSLKYAKQIGKPEKIQVVKERYKNRFAVFISRYIKKRRLQFIVRLFEKNLILRKLIIQLIQ